MALLEPFCAYKIPHQDVRDRMVTWEKQKNQSI